MKKALPTVTLALLIFALPTMAEQHGSKAVEQEIQVDPEGVTGIVFNQSFSNNANDFVRGFMQVWHQQYADSKHSISLKETQASLNGTKMTVNHKQNTLYTRGLSRRADNSANGRKAAEYVISKLRTLGTNRNSDIDLAEDEF